TGELESKETIEILRKRQEALKTKLDRAIRAGAVSDMLKLERKRDFEGLLDELRRMEKEFNAATVTGQRNIASCTAYVRYDPKRTFDCPVQCLLLRLGEHHLT